MVVGESPESMIANGFTAVGQFFPVFLHPDTKEEYALARLERSTGPGYGDFEFHTAQDVSLEDDLRRRDLTINAIAQNNEGQLIDPYGGQADLDRRILRHVSPAFDEDPLRVLRLARFKAQLSPFNFTIAGDTLDRCRTIVHQGSLAALTQERIFIELNKALATPKPALFFQTLGDIGALHDLFPVGRPSTLTCSTISNHLSHWYASPASLRRAKQRYPATYLFPNLASRKNGQAWPNSRITSRT